MRPRRRRRAAEKGQGGRKLQGRNILLRSLGLQTLGFGPKMQGQTTSPIGPVVVEVAAGFGPQLQKKVNKAYGWGLMVAVNGDDINRVYNLDGALESREDEYLEFSQSLNDEQLNELLRELCEEGAEDKQQPAGPITKATITQILQEEEEAAPAPALTALQTEQSTQPPTGLEASFLRREQPICQMEVMQYESMQMMRDFWKYEQERDLALQQHF
ncbi:hypothetical protein L484_027916 [Morus notabilis]|uniref:Uncharacterized protein n=1 Tax=Morus notabilis TaxID=981085 RepID=W9S7K4_9ROSA|nr:hypothetical protein L484_027916 [Morus notabilis]